MREEKRNLRDDHRGLPMEEKTSLARGQATGKERRGPSHLVYPSRLASSQRVPPFPSPPINPDRFPTYAIRAITPRLP
ncbi:hypothetical protein CGMCC3_g16815 [Colletotrichum fructicola]|nr:uncharacterized protein CGMCC3_g16815 [Colletotrichum fructicola]KAE9567020.1 hypothetical protein CGMCC3_g16815 [Colletotrichum fructicola]